MDLDPTQSIQLGCLRALVYSVLRTNYSYYVRAWETQSVWYHSKLQVTALSEDSSGRLFDLSGGFEQSKKARCIVLFFTLLDLVGGFL